MCAFHFFGCFLDPMGTIDPATHATEMIASAETTRLGVTPSPERHRRYLAARLSELIALYPVTTRQQAPSGVLVISMGNAPAPPPLDPEGVCVRCHSFGTVARLTELSTPPTTRRYCEPCWVIVRAERMAPMRGPPRTVAEHIARLDRSGGPPTESESRSWTDTIESLRDMNAAIEHDAGPPEKVEAHCVMVASAILEREDRMLGPMPPEVEAFVHRYGPTAL
jgi:hypothetical protein